MEICSCERCGKVVVKKSPAHTLCISCFEQEEFEFKRIKEFLNNNPLATVFQVSVNLDVPVRHIKRYLRENRLEIVERDNQKNIFLRCEGCGIPILTGYYCTKCATSSPHNYKSVYINDNNTKTKEYPKTSSVKYSKNAKACAAI